MSKLHFLKEGCLLCLQFIALLLKDMMEVKLLPLIIRFNANMSWMMVLCTEILGDGQVDGRVVVAPCFLNLYSLPHLGTTDPTISYVKQARALHTLWRHQPFALPHSCSCGMAISALPGFTKHRVSALPVLNSLVIQLCAVVVSELFFTNKTGWVCLNYKHQSEVQKCTALFSVHWMPSLFWS